jgi:hypothetical protein
MSRRTDCILLFAAIMCGLAAGTDGRAAAEDAWQEVAGGALSTATSSLPGPVLFWPGDGGTGESARPTFKWSEVPGKDITYRIMVATSPDMLPTDPKSDTCSACAINDTANEPAYTPAAGALRYTATYYWQVAARNPTVRGAWSSVASFSTQVVDLPAPTLLSPADGTTAQLPSVTFSWSEVPGADRGYRILVATSRDPFTGEPTVGACSRCVIDDTSTGTSYTPASGVLRYTTTYYWQVQAISSKTYGMWSGPATFTTQVAEQP